MSRAWNPAEFTVAQFAERLKVSYDAALHLLSSLADDGYATRHRAERDSLKANLKGGKGVYLWKLHPRRVKNRTLGPDKTLIG